MYTLSNQVSGSEKISKLEKKNAIVKLLNIS